ncbi:MAG TPA: BON domain-containing protein, partial [Devosia sp.]|nr:BON domain-containing protein [Devosia sp.]
MTGTILKLLVPGGVTVVAGTALALAMTTSPIATDLEGRATQALAGGELDWASVRLDGRDAVLAGTATTQAMIDEAVLRLANITGVRGVSSDVVLAEHVSPFPFAAAIKFGVTTLSGGYPDETVHAALLAHAGEVTDRTRMLSGAPPADAFEAGATFGLDALKLFDQGQVELADLSLNIKGRAKDIESYAALQQLRNTVPVGVTLAALEVTPPLASPFVWTASYDGGRLAMTGNVPDEAFSGRLRATVPTAVRVSTSLVQASGAPLAFESRVFRALAALMQLERGELSVVDGVVTLSGAPESSAVAAKVAAAVAELEGTAELEPPRAPDYKLSIDKSAGGIEVAGFVPDEATREKLTALAGPQAADVELARGAPEFFASGLDYGIEVLSHLSDGRYELRGDRLSFVGRAGTVADFKTLVAKAEEGAPQGFTLALGEISPPVAEPFTFSASKSGEALALRGFVPDETTRMALHQGLPIADDTADPADGAPAGFATSARQGLDLLSLLDSGELAFDGTGWSLAGEVDSPQEAFVAEAAFAATGLRAQGWGYRVQLPEPPAAATLPIISPYAWRAQKTFDGAVSFTGFSPSDAFKSYLKVRSPGGRDGTVLGAGSPADFPTAAAAGLDALLALDEGSLGLNGDRWTLTGTVADAEARTAIQTALAAQVEAAQWQIAIQARDSAPVVTPYLWSATKRVNGTVDFTGYLPNEELRANSALSAPLGSRDTTAIASGEPAGFAEDLVAGL